MQLQSKHVGALAGIVIGLLILHYGFVAAVFLAAMGAIGWIIGRVLDGEIDVTQYLGRRNDLE